MQDIVKWKYSLCCMVFVMSSWIYGTTHLSVQITRWHVLRDSTPSIGKYEQGEYKGARLQRSFDKNVLLWGSGFLPLSLSLALCVNLPLHLCLPPKHTNTHTHSLSLSFSVEGEGAFFSVSNKTRHARRHPRAWSRDRSHCWWGSMLLWAINDARADPLLHPGKGSNASSRVFVVVWSDYILADTQIIHYLTTGH